MTEWGVVGILITLVGFALTIGKPIVTLNSTIVRVITKLEDFERRFEADREESTKVHHEIIEHATEQDKLIADHEIRIVKLEVRNIQEATK